MDFDGGNGGGSSKRRYGEVEVRRRPAAAASPYWSDGDPAAARGESVSQRQETTEGGAWD